MRKFNSLTKTMVGETFVFITRGRAKPFTEEEAMEYLKQRLNDFRTFPIDVDTAVAEIKKPFCIHNELRMMFLKDMRQFGVKHCMNKYGGTKEDITSEATRIAPYMNRELKE